MCFRILVYMYGHNSYYIYILIERGGISPLADVPPHPPEQITFFFGSRNGKRKQVHCLCIPFPGGGGGGGGSCIHPCIKYRHPCSGQASLYSALCLSLESKGREPHPCSQDRHLYSALCLSPESKGTEPCVRHPCSGQASIQCPLPIP